MTNINADLLPLAVDITTPILLQGNPRQGDVEAIQASYEKFGQRKPIVIRRADNVVLAGNHQLLAARALGWKQIAAVFVDDDLTTSNAFVLADNRTSDLGKYDDRMLLDLLTELDATAGLFGTGYDDDYLEELRTFIAVSDAAANYNPDTDTYEPAEERLTINENRVVVNIVLHPEDRPKLYDLIKDLPWIIDARNAHAGKE